MFLDALIRRNSNFIEAAISMHQLGRLPANSYVIDLEAVERNAKRFQDEAKKYGLTTFAMTKQVGRHSSFCQAIMRGGINRSVAVDVACAVACDKAGLRTGHIGHLVQVPSAEADFVAAKLKPDYWTVFSVEKAIEAAGASLRAGHKQKFLTRIQTSGDTFYRGHEGGFNADDIIEVANALNKLDGGHFAGITTFPALLFDQSISKVKPTPNLATLQRAAEKLRSHGWNDIEINAPGTTSSVVLSALAEAGATQCEPGNGLHGTTPLHAIEDLPEDPAVLYLTEVSHNHSGRAYCFGGGLYIDPVFPNYQVKALVTSEPVVRREDLYDVEMPDYSAIDYYAMIDQRHQKKLRAGDSVIFGFRGQAFVTRAHVAGLKGLSCGKPEVTSIENSFGYQTFWPGEFRI